MATKIVGRIFSCQHNDILLNSKLFQPFVCLYIYNYNYTNCILKGNIFHSRFVLLLNYIVGLYRGCLYVMQASLDTGLLY